MEKHLLVLFVVAALALTGCTLPLDSIPAPNSTLLQVEVLDMNVGGDYAKVYCYVSFEDTPEVRLPVDKRAFIQVAAGRAEITNLRAGNGKFAVPVPADGSLDISGECWGWSGADLDKLGRFSGEYDSQTWDGTQLTLKGDSYQLGFAIKKPSLTPLKPAGRPKADLAVTGFFAEKTQGPIYVELKNNGPDALPNGSVNLFCWAVRTPYATGAQATLAAPVGFVNFTLASGDAVRFDTHIQPVDTTQYWYKVTCGISIPNFLDTDASNDSLTDSVPPGKPKTDLEVSAIFAQTAQGPIYVKLKNNGPSNLHNGTVELTCGMAGTPYAGGSQTILNPPLKSISVNLVVGGAADLDTLLSSVDTTKYSYSGSCSMTPRDYIDTNPNNDGKNVTIP